MKDWNDKSLFDALRNGNRAALSTLFRRHYDKLLHYGLRVSTDTIVVEGCIQELFLYFFESYDRFLEVKQVRAYLFKSLRHRILAASKVEKRQKRVNEENARHLSIQFNIEDLIIQREIDIQAKQVLVIALNGLPPRQKEAIYLRYYGSLNTREIAEIMGVTNQTILNTLHQALKKLRSYQDIKQLRGLDK